ncbi:hypothetical protein L5515_018787 [Caenorhabditis briggsae]|uniref:Serpentine receptor class gamma n=1 Tax=Caenorhabditis briggsae TaxID=6238 RepID=A0AAE9JSQ4_CAEBR|nr:hypothetical protein L5515_018787 [Caenorhabditis briggsae]
MGLKRKDLALQFNLAKSSITRIYKRYQNFTTFLNSFLSLRLPMFTKTTGFLAPFFLQFTKEHSQKWLCIPHALHFAFAYGQYNFNFGVCLNRWTIIKFNNFETCWKAYFWVFIVVTIGIPAALVIPILLNTSYYSQNTYWNTFYIDSTFGRENIYMILTPYLTVVTGVNVYMNISSYRKMIKLANSGFSVPDKRFLVISFYVFTVDMFLTALSVANCTILNFQPFIDNLTVLSWIAFCTPFASDVLTFCSPLLTFTMCHSLRVKFIECLPSCLRQVGYRFFVRTSDSYTVSSVSHQVQN